MDSREGLRLRGEGLEVELLIEVGELAASGESEELVGHGGEDAEVAGRMLGERGLELVSVVHQSVEHGVSQPLGAMALTQTEDPQARAEALLGMDMLGQDRLDQGGDGRPTCCAQRAGAKKADRFGSAPPQTARIAATSSYVVRRSGIFTLRQGIDATTLEANAALRSIVRRDTGASYDEFLRGLARALGD
ncbi:MAG TPA: hypothetical protein VHR45_10035 [Thermoanaerobaculia bacterium]|nr:hypothetical protein [Thermoanaerobaculia bacterium]